MIFSHLHGTYHLPLQLYTGVNNAQKMKFSIKDFFSKCDQIRSFLRIWSHLLKKPLMENFIFCAVKELFYSVTNLIETEIITQIL